MPKIDDLSEIHASSFDSDGRFNHSRKYSISMENTHEVNTVFSSLKFDYQKMIIPQNPMIDQNRDSGISYETPESSTGETVQSEIKV